MYVFLLNSEMQLDNNYLLQSGIYCLLANPSLSFNLVYDDVSHAEVHSFDSQIHQPL